MFVMLMQSGLVSSLESFSTRLTDYKFFGTVLTKKLRAMMMGKA